MCAINNDRHCFYAVSRFFRSENRKSRFRSTTHMSSIFCFVQGWGARGKGTIFSQLMVLWHASEKFRLAYELPLDRNELFGVFHQFYNITVEDLDEKSYRSDLLMKSDLWKKKNVDNELNDYRDLNDNFYENDLEEIDEDEDYDENLQAPLVYQWHRDRHFDIRNSIVKYVDDKM